MNRLALTSVAVVALSPLALRAQEAVPTRPKVPGGSVQSPIRKLKEPGAALPAMRADNTAGKIRRYAENLIQRYDADGNGQLTESEWASLDEPLRISDLDRDGVITAQELSRRIITYGRRRSLRPAPLGPQSPVSPEGAVAQTSDVRAANPNERTANPPTDSEARQPAKRYFVPSARLPGGLADWFTAADADGDGQVTAAELATAGNTEAVANFSRYDLNDDGVITAAESIAAQKAVADAKAKSEQASIAGATSTAVGENRPAEGQAPR